MDFVLTSGYKQLLQLKLQQRSEAYAVNVSLVPAVSCLVGDLGTGMLLNLNLPLQEEEIKEGVVAMSPPCHSWEIRGS